MHDRAGLLADGRDDLRVAVTGIGHTDAAGEIKVLFSIRRVNGASLGALSNNGEYTRPNRGHVGEILIIKLSHVSGAPVSGVTYQVSGVFLDGMFQTADQSFGFSSLLIFCLEDFLVNITNIKGCI